jgi:hypothetical protein
MTVQYTDHTKVLSVKETDQPRYGVTSTGYGGKIPTRYMVRYGARWHRVYMLLYSNAGIAYIVSGGVALILDDNTEWRLALMKGERIA